MKLVCLDVGLNVMSHLKETMDQFAPDVDEHYHSGIARHVLTAFHRFAVRSHFMVACLYAWQAIMFHLLFLLFFF